LPQFKDNPELITTFNYRRSFNRPGDLHVREMFDVIYAAAVAYNFDLNMSENNDLGAGVNLLGAWQATFTAGINGNSKRMRANERTFTITDTFSYLLTTLNTPVDGVYYCDGHITTGPNYVYPIIGRIGIWNTVYTFFQLSFFDNLAPDKAKPGVGGTPALADILTFTTQFDLTGTPKVVFAQAKAGGNQIADASLTPSVTRKDIHAVTVALALDTKGTAPLTSFRGFVFSPERNAGVVGRPTKGQVLVLNRVTASTTTNAERIAVNMIDQLKSRELQLIPAASF
jgi:hypothetical protein